MATARLDADLLGTLTDQTKYHSKIGGLMYLTASRPDIAFATFDSSFELIVYSDANHEWFHDDYKSTSRCIQLLGVKLVSWSSKKQDCTALSTAIEFQLADLFTKALPKERFKYLGRRIANDEVTFLSLHAKVKGLKSSLKLWLSHTRESEVSRKKSTLDILRSLDENINTSQASEKDQILLVNTWQELDNLKKLISMDLLQKAQVRWVVEGDENSKFFHGIINSKRKSQTIEGILHEGVWITDPSTIKLTFLTFYKEKFSCHDTSVILPPMSTANRLSDLDRSLLDSMVSLEEIKNAVWDCGSQKAPGLNGFSFMFVKKYWDIMKHDIHNFMVWFFSSGSFPPVRLLIGIRRKEDDVTFKVDFEMAFDLVSWRFLDHAMDKLDFSGIWRKWIMAGLKSSRASILFNGSPTSEFSLKRGSRQGDPLSPFLFIIVIEGLHIALRDGLRANLFRGVKIGSSDIRLSHLFYADDVIILSEWNQHDMDNIIRILNVFYLASGLKINIYKSNLYGVGVSSNEVDRMAASIGCSASNFPLHYLGLPIGTTMNQISSWNVLIDRFKNRLSGWKANMLSSGGCLNKEDKPERDGLIDPTSLSFDKLELCMRTRNSNFPNNSPVTIPRRRNRRRAPNVVEPELRTIVEVAPMAERTMEELLRAPTEGYGEAIVIPEINADHFEIKTNLLQLVQASPFHGFERENPHTHINNFKRITSTLKFRDVPNDVIKLMMFPYSLEGAARVWYDKEPPNSILTWEDLVTKFVNQFFPPSKTTHLKNEISRFTQKFEETFSEAWERFKEMLRACPHHGFTELTQIDTFYNSSMRMIKTP
ncbi:reverse transcriptase domain-containing protein [Tanacetum coccineum]